MSGAIQNAQAAPAAAAEAALEKPAVNGELAADTAPPAHQAAVFALHEKYAKEREKRLRADGNSQYVKLASSKRYKHLANDPWAEKEGNRRLALHDDMHAKVLVVGGGLGGLCFAVRMVQAGIKPEDIIVVDAAGGYGGTWWWNRYPGLMCDVESWIYLPLLEETGYIPKHKYSYGPEIKAYASMIAKKWQLDDRGAFQQRVDKLDWDEAKRCWQVQTWDLKTNKSARLTANFVTIASGLLHNPKMNEFEGLDKYQGHFFHTARWDYDYTGGSPEDTNLTNLKNKRVGIIGTGATAVQAVPHLARCSKELYVFQRTPSSIDERGQRPTDLKDFKENVANHDGWQWERIKNYNSFINRVEPLPDKNLVNDGWTNFPAYTALLGGPRQVTMENVADHVAQLHALDVPRSEALRQRVEHTILDKDTADKLKAWYPGWCKRPCFHDDYLPTFNRPNVHLVDTDGKGIDRLTETGIVANGVEYDLDCIIFSTGYSLEASLCPARMAGIAAHGRSGKSMDDKWSGDIATLHGIITRDFPNLFFTGPAQSTASPNYSAVLDLFARSAAYIVSQALKNADADHVVVEPSKEAEEAWTMRCMAGAFTFAAVSGCTPSYLNSEGEVDSLPMEEKMKRARASMWSQGMNGYAEYIEGWEKDGRLTGLEVTAA